MKQEKPMFSGLTCTTVTTHNNWTEVSFYTFASSVPVLRLRILTKYFANSDPDPTCVDSKQYSVPTLKLLS